MIGGMLVSGFIVRATHPFNTGEPLDYGLFPTVEAAQAWADMMTIPVVVEPVYAPTFNRG